MRKTVLAILCMPMLLFSCSSEESEELENTKHALDLADPYILYDDGRYYAYGTKSAYGIMCFSSDNLESWTAESIVLHKDDSYGDENFWAPEVYKLDDKSYAMAYSAEEHICIAFSSSPTGPFKQDIKKPILSGKAIDNHIFIDDDGKMYMYFVQFTNGNEIWGAELNDNYEILTNTLTSCIHATEDWETEQGKITEGPFVVKRDGQYLLTYSANHYQSQDYAVGYARASSPLGPWTKATDNPVLHRPGNLVGTGHHSLFKDKDGNDKIVFHAHNTTTTVQPRLMYVSDCKFTSEAGNVVFSVSEDYIETYYYGK